MIQSYWSYCIYGKENSYAEIIPSRCKPQRICGQGLRIHPVLHSAKGFMARGWELWGVWLHGLKILEPNVLARTCHQMSTHCVTVHSYCLALSSPSLSRSISPPCSRTNVQSRPRVSKIRGQSNTLISNTRHVSGSTTLNPETLKPSSPTSKKTYNPKTLNRKTQTLAGFQPLNT